MRQRDWRTLGGLVLIGIAVGIAAWLLGPGEADALRERARLAEEAAHAALPDVPNAPLADAAEVPAPAPLLDDHAAAAPPLVANQPGEALHLTGRVVDTGHRPIADARVTHWPTERQRSQIGLSRQETFSTGIPWERLASTRTDADGRFVLDVRDETLDRHVLGGTSAFGGLFGDEMEARPILVVEHPAHGTLASPVTAEHPGAMDTGDIVLAPGATLLGRLVDPNGAPVAGIPLSIELEGRHLEGEKRLLELQALRTVGVSDAAGRFRIPGLWPGQFSLGTLPTAFAPLTRSVTIDSSGELDLGNVRMDPGGRIAGIVLDGQDRPVPGASVRLRPSLGMDGGGPDSGSIQWDMEVHYGKRPIRHDTLAGTDGRFTVTGLWDATQDFDVMARADGLDASVATKVAAGREDVVLHLPPQATWHLRVVDAESGAPLAGASLYGRRRGGERDYSTGHIEAELVEGVHVLRGASRTRTDAVVSAPGHATQVFMLPGLAEGEQGEQTLSLPRESCLAGRVVDDEERPLEGAAVELSAPPEQAGTVKQDHAFTDAQGRFRFGGLAAGEWSLEACAHGCLPMAEGLKVTLAVAASQEDVQIVLPRGGTITGVVLGAEGQPAPGCWISAESTSPEALLAAVQAGRPAGAPTLRRVPESVMASGFAGMDGRFTLAGVAPGAWKVDGGRGAEAAVTLAGRETVDVVLRRPQPPRVTGRVTREGQAVSGALVELGYGPDIGNDWLQLVATHTDAAGSYALELASDQASYLRATAAGLSSRPVKVELAWNGVQQVDLVLPTGRVRGRVVDDVTGGPAAGVALKLGDPDLLSRNRSDVFALETTSGPDGGFVFEPVGAGTWMLEADHTDWCVARLGDVTVVERGAEPDVTVRLQRGASIEVDFGANPGGLSGRLTLKPLGGGGTDLHSNGKFKDVLRFNRLAAGDYELTVERRDDKVLTPVQNQKVSVQAGETVRIHGSLGG